MRCREDDIAMVSSLESISGRSSRVRQLFQDLIAHLKQQQRHEATPNGRGFGSTNEGLSHALALAQDITDSLERFTLWAGNLGALLAPTARLSLDHRLSDAPETSERICEVLDDLAEAISECKLSLPALSVLV
jgi:hypothetical protein